MLSRIISGGQTGADQAALDAAIELGVPHGGWIPKGRLTEAGPLPNKYALIEMPNKDYLKRTRQNVLDSDGTVIFSHGDLKGGSKRTVDFANELCKPFLHNTPLSESAEVLAAWVKRSAYTVSTRPRRRSTTGRTPSSSHRPRSWARRSRWKR